VTSVDIEGQSRHRWARELSSATHHTVAKSVQVEDRLVRELDGVKRHSGGGFALGGWASWRGALSGRCRLRRANLGSLGLAGALHSSHHLL